jgi:hypothetical protein
MDPQGKNPSPSSLSLVESNGQLLGLFRFALAERREVLAPYGLIFMVKMVKMAKTRKRHLVSGGMTYVVGQNI